MFPLLHAQQDALTQYIEQWYSAVTFQKRKKKEIISGQKSQIGLDTKTY
jgi:hypothetical protein